MINKYIEVFIISSSIIIIKINDFSQKGFSEPIYKIISQKLQF
jgi:hypothetical protein